jgi:3',5'-nucleoside bisphosphate phosphatase
MEPWVRPVSSGRRRFMHSVFSSGSGWDVFEVDLRNIHRGVSFQYDCHVHTSASDGQRSPGELALEVYSRGLSVVVADHYCVSGAASAAQEFDSLTRGFGELGGHAGVCAGVEFSVRVELAGLRHVRKLHVLGVGVDAQDRRLSEWLARYRRLRGLDIGHALGVKGELEDEGFVFPEDVDARLGSKRNVYQVLAEALFGVWCNRRLIERRFGVRIGSLASRRRRRVKHAKVRRKMVASMRRRYGDFTAAKPGLDEVVSLVKGAGGLAVVAHPVRSVPQMPHFSHRKLAEVFESLWEAGVDGVEAYTPTHRLEVADSIAKAALDAGLMVFGGSDAHRLSDELGRLTRDWCRVPSPQC